MKDNHKEVKISFWASHFTTIVSVTLVLLLGGAIAMIWIGANNESRRLKERLELSVILADSIPDSEGQRLARDIEKQPYCAQVRFVSRDEALQMWTRDTGENLEELFGVNPLSPEVNFTLKSEYASTDSIARIVESLRKICGVESVESPEDEMIEAMNKNIATITLVLGAIGLVMILISFVLINNTVHLAIYSRRFTIHTMQLVGATNSFIRWPIVLNNMLCGLISGIMASGLLALVIFGAKQGGLEDIATFLPWMMYGIVAGGMVIVGILLCGLTSWIASTIYLRKDYDELFK